VEKEKKVLKTLNQLGKDEVGQVKENHTSGELRQRLIDMGIVLNSPIKVLKVAPLGSPIDILVKGYQLSLRKDEAEKIMVEVE
jgi:ferrous iron transport protein A